MNFNLLDQILQDRGIDLELCTFDTIDSTNIRAAELLKQEHARSTLFVANSQTNGQGRQGRSWESAAGKGIWATLALPEFDPNLQYTQAISVAICQEMISRGAGNTSIKWPNDVLIGNKKVAGILGQTVKTKNNNQGMVLGFGINVHHHFHDFPEELRNTATSLQIETGIEGPTEEILANVVSFFLEALKLTQTDLVDRYRSLSSTIGRYCILDGQRVLAQGVTPQGGLVILTQDRQHKTVFSGTLRYEESAH